MYEIQSKFIHTKHKSSWIYILNTNGEYVAGACHFFFAGNVCRAVVGQMTPSERLRGEDHQNAFGHISYYKNYDLG